MAKDVTFHVKLLAGDLLVQLASCHAEIERLTEELAAAKQAIAPLEKKP